jgi:LmbE family N-acetylglucosaminyl deacetylase
MSRNNLAVLLKCLVLLFFISVPSDRVTSSNLSFIHSRKVTRSLKNEAANKPRKCIMVFGAHADDVEPMAGGTFAKYISEGYEGIYVCVINNFAGCGIESVGGGTEPPPGVKGPLFSISNSPQSYPVDALETVQIRQEEAKSAASVFHATNVFLDFREGFVWQGRKRCFLGSDAYHQFDPPGRQAVSLAEEEPGNTDFIVGLLKKYSPEIVIIHTLGGDKHDHGNSAYITYLAFREAMRKGVAVGKLWMRPKGWLLENQAKADGRGKADVQIDVKKYIDLKYEALNKHVSQKGTLRKQSRPEEVTEEFITVLDNTN